VFVTHPRFEHYIPAIPGTDDEHWWRAVTLFASSHWFLFEYALDVDGQVVCQTAFVSDEWTLLSCVSGVPADRRGAMKRFDRDAGSTEWICRRVDALWLSASAEIEALGVLLFQIEGETQLRDCRLTPVVSGGGRRLFSQHPRRLQVPVPPSAVTMLAPA
jgi:hypothetical protein